jgi:hypothetical protein
VFVYDVAQLQDSNPTRARKFRRDLEQFLDLQAPLNDPMLWIKPGQAPASSERAKELAAMKINICDDQHAQLRQVLWKQASQSASWMQNEFFLNPNVKVSSPDYFAKLLDSWHHDPCNATPTKS